MVDVTGIIITRTAWHCFCLSDVPKRPSALLILLSVSFENSLQMEKLTNLLIVWKFLTFSPVQMAINTSVVTQRMTHNKMSKFHLHTQIIHHSFVRHKLGKTTIHWREWRRKSIVHHPQTAASQQDYRYFFHVKLFDCVNYSESKYYQLTCTPGISATVVVLIGLSPSCLPKISTVLYLTSRKKIKVPRSW